MKKVSKFVAFIATACIVLSSTVSVFAAELSIKTKDLVNQNTKMVIGTYPIIDGCDDINKEIYDKVWRGYQYNAIDSSYASAKNVFTATYDGVEYAGDIAKITVSLHYKQSNQSKKGDYTETVSWYINAATKATAGESDFTAAQEAGEEEAAPAAEDTTPVIDAAIANRMVSVRKLEDLGYKLTWNESMGGSITINDADDKYLTIVVAETNSYFKNGSAVTLVEAPKPSGDDDLLVPAEFFSKVLGLKVVADGSKDVKISK
ncbi:MAG: copper amine oxidase N-terminal domain-containing protein [Clostridiales bacterium]|jgi:hypothetical protein|nr:copper amine oxidase N-terminal domain-containing protein [Clostridiales bacterium]